MSGLSAAIKRLYSPPSPKAERKMGRRDGEALQQGSGGPRVVLEIGRGVLARLRSRAPGAGQVDGDNPVASRLLSAGGWREATGLSPSTCPAPGARDRSRASTPRPISRTTRGPSLPCWSASPSRRPILMGFSDGGEYSLLMAALRPDIARSIVTWGGREVVEPMPGMLDAFFDLVDDPIQPLREFSEYLKAAYGEANARVMVQSESKALRAIIEAGGDISRSRAGEIRGLTALEAWAGGRPAATRWATRRRWPTAAWCRSSTTRGASGWTSPPTPPSPARDGCEALPAFQAAHPDRQPDPSTPRVEEGGPPWPSSNRSARPRIRRTGTSTTWSGAGASTRRAGLPEIGVSARARGPRPHRVGGVPGRRRRPDGQPAGGRGRARLALLRKHPDGVGTLNFEVEDVERTFRLLDARGGTFIEDIQRVDDRGGKLALLLHHHSVRRHHLPLRPARRVPGALPRDASRKPRAGKPLRVQRVDHITSNFQTMAPALLWMEHVMGFERYWSIEFHTEDVKPTGGPRLRAAVHGDVGSASRA